MGGHSYSSHHYGNGGRVNYSSGGDADPKVYLYLIIFAAVVTYAITAGVLYPKGKNGDTVLGLSETRPLSLSSTWHQSISVGAPSNFNTSASATLMRFKNMPPIGSTDSWTLEQPNTPLSSYDNYWWSWYLAPGSSLTFSWAYSIPINVYLIKSDAGLSAYNKDASITKYLENSFPQTPFGSISFTVKSGDIYYAIVENWDTPKSAAGGANFTIHSVQYNLNNPDDKCIPPCSMTVAYRSSDHFFFYTPTVTSQLAARKGGPLSEISFNVKIATRGWFVGVILFLIPLSVLIGLLVFSVWWFSLRDPSNPCKCFIGCCTFKSRASSSRTLASYMDTSHSVEMSPSSSAIHSTPYHSPTPTGAPYPDSTYPTADSYTTTAGPTPTYDSQPTPVAVEFVPNTSYPNVAPYNPNAAPYNEYNMTPAPEHSPAPYNPDPAPPPYNPNFS